MLNMVQFIVDEGTGGNTPPDDGNQNGGSGTPPVDDSGNTPPDIGNETPPESGTQDVKSLPEWAQSMITGLRTENGDKRTKANNLQTRLEKIEGGLKSMFGEKDDQMTPEDRVSHLSKANEEAEFNNSILMSAIQNGVGADDLEYFSFKMNKALDGLEEGQEFSEDQFAAIIQDVKGKSSKGQTNTSVNGKGGEPNPNTGTTIKVDQFAKMGLLDRTKMFRENRPLYDQLHADAKIKGLL